MTDDARSLERLAADMRARAGLTRPGDLLRIGDHGGLVVGAPLTAEQWEAKAKDARLPDSPPALPQE